MIRQSLMPKEMLRDWKVQPTGGIFGDSAEGKKRSPRCFEKMWSNLTGREEYDEDDGYYEDEPRRGGGRGGGKKGRRSMRR